MAKKYETVKDVLEEVDKLVEHSYTHHQVDKDLAVKDKQKAFELMKEFIKKLHPGTRVL